MKHVLLSIAGCLSLAVSAEAVINPELTPVHLVRQSDQVWLLEISPAEQPNRLNVKLLKALKGQPPERSPVIDLTGIAKLQPAVLFVADAAGMKIGSLYAGGKWYRLTSRTPVLWQAESADRSLGGTWNGSVEMLARAVEYIQSDPSATVPATCDAAWGEPQKIAMFADVRGLRVVDRGGGPRLVVEANDRLLEYSPDNGKLIDSQPLELIRNLASLVGFEPPGRPLSVTPADFDADGKLDLLAVYSDGLQIWSNDGEGKFRDTFSETGELAAMAPAKPTGAIVCDINNDGRQDICVWSDEAAPQLFYNRGFRCFAVASNLAFVKYASSVRVKYAAIADFNSDGCQDLAAATTDGFLTLLPRDPSKGNRLAVSLSLPSSAGPVTVSGTDGKRPLGAQLLQAGQSVFFGKTGKGPLKLEWRLADGAVKSKQVIVLKPTQVVLEP